VCQQNPISFSQGFQARSIIRLGMKDYHIFNVFKIGLLMGQVISQHLKLAWDFFPECHSTSHLPRMSKIIPLCIIMMNNKNPLNLWRKFSTFISMWKSKYKGFNNNIKRGMTNIRFLMYLV
jgi:hypothetical protein